MSAVVSDALPVSRRALERLAEANEWERDRVAMRERSVRLAWRVTAAAVAFGLMGMAIGVWQSRRPAPPPVPIVVDRTTGEAIVVPQLTASTVPAISALDQHNAAVYVRAREAYNFGFLKRDYEQVARMSIPEVFTPYAARFTGEGAMQSKVGTAQEHRITIVSARPSATSQAGRRGEVIVTYDREIRYAQGLSPNTTRHVATVIYEYRPESIKLDVDRIENPLGFVVTAYRTETELIAPKSEAGR